MDGERVEQAAELLRQAQHVCALTGAGISAESGVPTFRGPGGSWQGSRVEDVATPSAFRANPRLVWQFYNWRRQLLRTVQPNPGHLALARLETVVPQFALITQNVDGLHQAAGSRRVMELHGNLWHVRCVGCDYGRGAEGESLPEEPRCPQCGDWLRPGVVWFGEVLPEGVFEAARQAACCCRVMLVIGTSGVVQPAASLAECAWRHGAAVIEINPERTPISALAAVRLAGAGGRILPLLVERACA
jgi:NAD-dependent deacetylase